MTCPKVQISSRTHVQSTERLFALAFNLGSSARFILPGECLVYCRAQTIPQSCEMKQPHGPFFTWLRLRPPRHRAYPCSLQSSSTQKPSWIAKWQTDVVLLKEAELTGHPAVIFASPSFFLALLLVKDDCASHLCQRDRHNVTCKFSRQRGRNC